MSAISSIEDKSSNYDVCDVLNAEFSKVLDRRYILIERTTG
jgi:hypothetical protein